MRTTLDINDALLREAQARAPARTKTALIELALQALIRESAYQRLADAAGSMPRLSIARRRRTSASRHRF